MTTIVPFSGIRYSLGSASTPADLISPPYDKISSEERKRLWNRHPQNVVRLILPPPSDQETDVMTQSLDNESADWYQEAAQRLQQWQSQGILIQDEACFYIYQQSFIYKDQPYTRQGLFVALRLEDNTGPHAHEFTFEGPKADRLRLLKATKTNLSAIFLLADGAASDWQTILTPTSQPILQFADHDGQTHNLYAIPHGDHADRTQDYLRNRTLVIADGHHRYETAKNYCQFMREETGQNPQTQQWGYVFALLVPIAIPGLLVLPTHRVLKQCPAGWLERVQQQAGPYFEITRRSGISGEQARQVLEQAGNENAILICSGQHTLLLIPKAGAEIPAMAHVPAAIRHLNVTLLHRFLFETCLQLDTESLQQTRYIRGEEEALAMVQEGGYEVAFIMKGIPTETVFEISQTGERMPQKSTDFYPKIPTGLLMRSAEGPLQR